MKHKGTDWLTQQVAAYIARHQLMNLERKYLVGVSGGADSVCLLLVLRRLGYHIEAVHCNFMLRGEESLRDEQFVRTLCNNENIELHITHFDTRAYASTHKVSIEMAARQLRYHYFEQLRTDVEAADVCVAHHRDDSAETVVMNLLRSTGLRGLTGLKPRQGHVVRPLLCVGRSDIVQWMDQHGQTYVTDSTNLQPVAVRNRLRLNVLPQMEQAMPGATASILATARHLEQAQRVYKHAIDQSLALLLHDDGIDIDRLLCEPSAECVLFEWLAPKGFNQHTIEDVARRLPQLGNQQGDAPLPHWLTPPQDNSRGDQQQQMLMVHRGRLVCRPVEAQRPTLVLPEPGCYAYVDGHIRAEVTIGAHVVRSTSQASLDADRVSFPLTLRPATTADRFQPFGMKGTKLVSDFLADSHVIPTDRQRQLVVTDATERVLWIVGRRTDGRFAVTSATRRTLLMSMVEEEMVKEEMVKEDEVNRGCT